LNIKLCSSQYSEDRAELKKEIKIELSFAETIPFLQCLFTAASSPVFIFCRNSYICKKFMDFEVTLRECKMKGG
jgi:hypothetical protein